jgi:hypothetical protein
MQKIFILQLILLVSFIYIIQCGDITIIGPDELSSQFSKKQIEMTFDKIGRSSYDFYTRGELFIPSDNSENEACQTLKVNNPRISQYEEDFKILLVKRGGCSFVQKARNAQKAGYSMILIVNNMYTKIKNIIMSDDGSGSDIFIPIAMISLDDGTKLINYLQSNKPANNKIIVEVNFLKAKEEYQSIDIQFFFSSSELRAYELLNKVMQYMHRFGDRVNLIPIYVVHRAPIYDEENAVRVVNCVSKGKYCYFPKETTITKDGQAIIMEDLRQKCLYQLNKKNNNINGYLNYLNHFHTECLIRDKTPKFNEKCAKDVLNSLGYSINDIDSCIANSFSVNDLSGNTYIDNDNNILKNEYDEILKNKLTTFPAVIINNKPLSGVIKESKIINEICHLLRGKPEFCSFIAGAETNKRKKILVFLLICFLIGINFLIFFVFRKYIIEKINEKIVQGGLDLDSRIKNVIGNIFSLNKLNNDYVKMKNNPSTSQDLQNQKGKVVDIAVEMT